MNQVESNWATKIGNKNPRLLGFIIILISIILVVINYVSLRISNFYYPEVYVITPIFFLIGLWVIITGRLHKSQNGTAPLWWQIGLYFICCNRNCISCLY